MKEKPTIKYEWINHIGLWRIFDPQYPAWTIAYTDDITEAVKTHCDEYKFEEA